MVLANPPFGKKSSISIVNDAGDLETDDNACERQDFWTATKNKQLNFVQHINMLLKVNGRCAIVISDNVLFEGGSRRDGPSQSHEAMRCTHAIATAGWDFLRRWGDGQSIVP
jgi:type I restriction-modification system DNA methylase subunit